MLVSTYHSLIESMPRRIRAVMAIKGGNTRYFDSRYSNVSKISRLFLNIISFFEMLTIQDFTY